MARVDSQSRTVREDLTTRLTQSLSQATDRSHDVPIDDPDTCTVKSARKLRTLTDVS